MIDTVIANIEEKFDEAKKRLEEIRQETIGISVAVKLQIDTKAELRKKSYGLDKLADAFRSTVNLTSNKDIKTELVKEAQKLTAEAAKVHEQEYMTDNAISELSMRLETLNAENAKVSAMCEDYEKLLLKLHILNEEA